MLIFSCELWDPIIEGCTTSTACNYNPEAKEDDNSCIDPLGCDNWCPDDTTEVKELDCAGVCGGLLFIDCRGECGILVVDECGVCGGNNAICTDCNGVVNGDAFIDSHYNIDDCNANECVGGNTGLEACTYDCTGYWGGEAEMDVCGVCNGIDNYISGTCNDCAGIPNGTAYVDGCGDCVGGNTGLEECGYDCAGILGGELIFDECGVCNGDNSTCKDCHGYINGTAYIDGCGDCVGGIMGLIECTEDCEGIFGGTLVYDDCGECVSEGDTTCIQGCDGIWKNDGSQPVVDECEICGGNNSSCIDCEGTPNGSATVDNCEECVSAGDTSCAYSCDGIWVNDGTQLVLDECNICGGDNSICSDCLGIPNGDAYIDNCETCDADTANDCMLDCGGEWGGDAIIDNCGACVYEGNTSCVQGCDGTWENDGTQLIIDQCGVCGGTAIGVCDDGCELPDMSLYLTDDGSVLYHSSIGISTFQFNVIGATIDYTSDMIYDIDGFIILGVPFSSQTNVAGLSIDGTTIQGCGTLIELDLSNTAELSGIIFTDQNENAIELSYLYNSFMPGCIDEAACNYTTDAMMDDGSCKYELDCNGLCGGNAYIDTCGNCAENIYYACDYGCNGTPGDIDNDGLIDISDITYLSICLYDMNEDCVQNICLYDMNGDAELNVMDRIILAGCVFYEYLNCSQIMDECNVPNGDGSTCSSTVTDIDGNIYEIVQIGEQLWMAENLKTTHYNNGDSISYPSDEDFGSYSEGQYGVYDNDFTNAEIYGNLYNWAVVDDDRGVCPDGWHVPTDDEYKTLEMFLGMSEEDANDTGYRGTDESSKLAGNSDLWVNGPLVNNSEFGTSGFTGLPAGYRTSPYYDYRGTYGYLWSSTNANLSTAWNRKLSRNSSKLIRETSGKWTAYTIRCLGD